MFLNCHTYYSLRYGTIRPEELVREAKRNGARALVLTDINCTTGIFDFVKACQEENIKPIAGIEFRVEKQLKYIGIARNNKGFQELNDFLTQHQLAGTVLPELAPAFINCYVIYPLGRKQLHELLENEFTGITLHDLRNFSLNKNVVLEKAVVLHPLTFKDPSDFNLHRQLRAIDHNALLSKLLPGQCAGSNEHFI